MDFPRRAQAQYEDFNLLEPSSISPGFSLFDSGPGNPPRDEWSGSGSGQMLYENEGLVESSSSSKRLEKKARVLAEAEGVAFERLISAVHSSRLQQQQLLLEQQRFQQRAQMLDSGILQRHYAAAQMMDSQQLLNHQLPVSLQHPAQQQMFHLPYQQQQQIISQQPLIYSSAAQARVQNQAMKLQAIEAAYMKCSQLLSMFIQEQRIKPRDNSVHFWKNLFRAFFTERATQRWCLSCYNSTHIGRHAQGLFPMEHWKCNLCGLEPGRGFDAQVDVLPRLYKIKYDSGLIEELFFLELPDDKYILPSGHIVFEYSRVVHESSFQEVRIIKHGRLRVTFNQYFKISSWEFCTKSHEEVIPRSILLPQAHQLSMLVREGEKESQDASVEKLKHQCNAFNVAAKQLAVKLDAPNVNDLGFSKRYVRCIQIAEVVDCMEDLISFSKATGLGPIESLEKFPNPRKRAPVEDSSPQSSSITHLQYQASPNIIQQQPGTPATISYNHIPPELRAQLLHQQSLIQQQQQQQQHQSLSRGELRSRAFNQRQQANSAHSNHTAQSLPGTPQSEMSDLRSNAG